MPTPDPYRHPVDQCPLCLADAAQSQLVVDAPCRRHPLWREGLPDTLHWRQCTACGHVHTAYTWSEAALGRIFSQAHGNQVADGVPTAETYSDQDRKKWAPVVETAIRLLGGFDVLWRGEQLWLDVGCGNGALVSTAQEYGFSALGLDIRAETANRLRELGYRAQQADFLGSDFVGQAQVISMADVLEHLPSPIAALRRARALLGEGGVLFISCPNMDAYSWRIMDRHGVNPYWWEIEHYHNFTRASLSGLLRREGFEVLAYQANDRWRCGMDLFARAAS
ncbi:class I SAM-dependent methyltransferase [Chitinimonas koreensis]|uniref:class I SAM-dependent methyltransferase n=1 Tax=Chitinimonas koreensis TaxID=356302 RepID=UPI0003FF8B9D|nr:class I SAM-dependent methyltransferase [Chitinimonas koreensis]QNM96186.1 class I SAM-dependent methyltransferase [Chitinimonas koreensis]